MVYESLLLFGIVFIAGWIFDTLTESRHALTLRHSRQAWLFLIIGAYFTFFWCRAGQTLAMQTWRIRLVATSGGAIAERVPLSRGVMRYLLAWLWFLPALVIDSVFGLKGWPSISVITVGMLIWLATVRINPDRQFLHDRLAGTRLVDVPKISDLPR